MTPARHGKMLVLITTSPLDENCITRHGRFSSWNMPVAKNTGRERERKRERHRERERERES
jgi:hypothetical protein